MDYVVEMQAPQVPEIAQAYELDNVDNFETVKIYSSGDLYYIAGNIGNSIKVYYKSYEEPVTPEICVQHCKEVLGLKINEIAKLVGVSRGTLDLHRKGSNVKDMKAYQDLYDFVKKIEEDFGTSLKKGLRNVLVERRTLVAHLIRNKSDLDAVYEVAKTVASKLGNINIKNGKVDNITKHKLISGIDHSA